MIVDDTKTERDCINYLIDRFNLPLDSKEASNGKEALQLLEAERFDILFTDVKMPLMDGLTLSKTALIHQPDLKIVIFSGYSEFEYAKTAIKLGVKEYLLKPLNPDEFNICMSNVLSEMSVPSTTRNSRVETVKQYIYRNYHKELSLDMLAALVYVHPDHLNRIFKSESGVTLNKFIMTYRLEKASDLLKKTHMKIRDVYTAVGYKNYSYFCQCFRKHFGVSPEKIRNVWKNEEL